MPRDADVYRGLVKIMSLLDQAMNVVASEPILSKVLAYEGDAGEASDPFAADGPSRQGLVDLVHGA